MATVKISELPTGQNVGLPSNAQVNWSSTTTGGASLDTGLARQGAGQLKATNGAGGLCDLYVNGVECSSAAYFGTTGQLAPTYQLNWGATAYYDTKDTGIARNAAGVVAFTNGSTGIRGLAGGGTAVASATAMPLPTGRVFHVTGTTNITSITSTNFASGAVITLIFDGVLTFTDGNNLKLAGNFVTTADDTITLAYDGTNWYETSRSVN